MLDFQVTVLAVTLQLLNMIHTCSEGAKIWSSLSVESQEVLRPHLTSRLAEF